MKNNSINQEILLFTNSGFAAREYAEKNEPADQPKLTQKEKMENACWNGILLEQLPEIREKKNNKDLTLWQINEAENFFYLQLGEMESRIEKPFSINPYIFLELREYSQ